MNAIFCKEITNRRAYYTVGEKIYFSRPAAVKAANKNGLLDFSSKVICFFADGTKTVVAA